MGYVSIPQITPMNPPSLFRLRCLNLEQDLGGSDERYPSGTDSVFVEA